MGILRRLLASLLMRVVSWFWPEKKGGWLVLALLLPLPLIAGGCAAMNYPTYADKAVATIAAGEQTKQALARALAEGLKSDDPRTRDQAAMTLLVMGLTHRTPVIEPPREGWVERGLGTLLSGLPYVGLAHVVGDAMKGHGGQRTTVNASNSGTGSVNVGLGAGDISSSVNLSASGAQSAVVVQHGDGDLNLSPTDRHDSTTTAEQ